MLSLRNGIFKKRPKKEVIEWRLIPSMACELPFMYDSKTTDIRGQYDRRAEKNLDGYRNKYVVWAERLINLEVPVLVRSLKSNNVELG